MWKGVGPAGVCVFGLEREACVVVVSALGGDALGGVLGAVAPACGHHRGQFTAVVGRRVGFRGRHTGLTGTNSEAAGAGARLAA